MNRLAVLCLLGSLLGASAAAQVGTQPTDAQVTDLIAQIKNMPASRLGKRLPATSLANWLQEESGPEGKVGWSFRHDPAASTRDSHRFPDCVEVDASLKDGRTFLVMIDVTDPHRPRVHDVSVRAARDLIEYSPRLSDLPRVLSSTR